MCDGTVGAVGAVNCDAPLLDEGPTHAGDVDPTGLTGLGLAKFPSRGLAKRSLAEEGSTIATLEASPRCELLSHKQEELQS